MLRVIVTPGALMAGSRRIFTSWSVEGIVTPQIEPVRAYLTPDGRYGGHGAGSAGGIWAAPPVDWKDRVERLNLPFATLDGLLPDDGIRAVDRRPHYRWTDPLLAARITGDFPSGRITLNYAQRIGTILDLPVASIRRITVDTSGPPMMRPGFENPVAEASLVADLVYPRKHILGFSANYDLGAFVVAPGALGGTSPVVRVETTYTLGHPFNSSQRVKEEITLADAASFPDVTSVAYPQFVQRNDFLQYMIGADWPLRIAVLNPRAELFNSFQVFHLKPIGADDRLAIQPYKRLLVRENQVFLTYLVFTEYLHRKIVPQILAGFDANSLSWFTKSKISHEIGDRWRIEWGILYFNRGRVAPTQSVFGLYDRRTDLFVRVGYQF